MLTQEYLCDRFSYDPLTGVFTRKLDGYVPSKPDPSNGYLRLRVAGKLHYVHRLIWCMQTGDFPSDEIDHLDRNRANNIWTNLVAKTKAQNAINKSRLSNNTSGVTGVSFVKRTGKWEAEVRYQGARYRLGSFRTIEEAKEVCLAKRKELGFSDTHGD